VQRGIAVVPEIDTPGHTTSIAAAYPEHIACAERAPWADYANEPPAGQLRFASPSTTSFAAEMFASTAGVFDGALFGTGGDELNTACYQKDAETQSILKEKNWTLEHALDVFTQGTHAALRKKGKAPVVWEEMALVHNVTLGPDTLVLCVFPCTTYAPTHIYIQGMDLARECQGRRRAGAAADPRAVGLLLPRLWLRRVDRRHARRDELVRPVQVVAACVHVRPAREPHARRGEAGARRPAATMDGAERTWQRRHAALAARRRLCRCAPPPPSPPLH
jgi:hypothetical protein